MNTIAKSPAITAAFKGIGAAVTGMIGASAALLLYNAKTALLPLLILFIICSFFSYQYKVSPVILIPLAGVAGAIFFKLL